MAARKPNKQVDKDSRPLNPKDSTFPLSERLSEDLELRTLELIFLLRQYFQLGRDEEWTVVMRELIKLGEVAVPELIGELDRTDELTHMQSLGFILCQINDPRSVPALIRSISRQRQNRRQIEAGACWQWFEPFYESDEWWHSPNLAPRNECGNCCPPEPIQGAIERITGHDPPNETGNVRFGWQHSDGFHEIPIESGDFIRVGWYGLRGSFLGFPDRKFLA